MSIKLWKKTKRRPQDGRYFAVILNQYNCYDNIVTVDELVYKKYLKKRKKIEELLKHSIVDIIPFSKTGDEAFIYKDSVLTWIRDMDTSMVAKWRYLTKKESAIYNLMDM